MRDRLARGAVLSAMAAAYVALATTSLLGKSITVDEFGHLPAGYHLLTTGNLRYAQLNPPLMNALSALPLLALDLRPSAGGNAPDRAGRFDFWRGGYDFMEHHRADYRRAFTAARMVTVVVVGLLGVLLYSFGRALVPEHPTRAGLLAAGLVWFSPNFLAHARLVTTDAACAATIVLVIFCLHRALARPQLSRTLAAGLALGAAMLVKFTAVWLYPLLPLQAWLLARRPGGSPASPRRIAAGLAVAFATSVLAINAGYGFQGLGRPIGELGMRSGPGRALQAVLPWLPSPLPPLYLSAFDRQLRDAQRGDPSYLLGESYHGGRWAYFPVLLAFKTPLPLLLLAGWAAVAGARQPRSRGADALLLLLPAGLLLAVFSLLSEKQLGVRQILPAAALGWLWVACAMARLDWCPRVRMALAALLLALAFSISRAHPHYLASYNLLAGGPDGGHRIALDSNLDWGQDLIGLADYLGSLGGPSVQLLYFGRADPGIYGIDYRVPRGRVEPGWLVVSETLLGRGFEVYDHGALVWVDAFQPPPDARLVARIHHSLRVYRIGPTAAAAAG